jgi:ER lumen protein retaining receptor
VFVCRYLDLFVGFIGWYNELMKVFYIAASAFVVFLILCNTKYSSTYNKTADTYRVEFLVIPAFLLACFINEAKWTDGWVTIAMEVLWAFSLFLEAVAVLPQLKMLHHLEDTTNITKHYMFTLGMYRGFYILNWIYRLYAESYWHWIAVIAGVVQTLLYVDFFILYYQSVLLTLPTGAAGASGSRSTWTSRVNKFMFGARRA